MTDEVRIVNAATGGEKGQKEERHDLLPVRSIRAIARHFGVGAKKYEDRNWERGYAWSLSYGALQRHLTAWWGGEDIDEETRSSHLAAAGFHVLALLEFIETHPELDDRPTTVARKVAPIREYVAHLLTMERVLSGSLPEPAVNDFFEVGGPVDDDEPAPTGRVSVRKVAKALHGVPIIIEDDRGEQIYYLDAENRDIVPILDALEDAGYEITYAPKA